MNVKLTRLNLREISISDLAFMHKLHACPEVDEYNTLGIPASIDVTQKLLNDMLLAQEGKVRNRYVWVVFIIGSNMPIGLCGFTLSNNPFKSGEIFYNLLPEFWGLGYGTEVAEGLLDVGFKSFGLHRIEAGVAVGNIGSIRVLEKVGMKREGCRRKILPIRGKWVDNYHYAIVEGGV